MTAPHTADEQEHATRIPPPVRDWRVRLEMAKNAAEVLAIAAAAVYFGYQTSEGWRRTNMDVTLRTERAFVAGTAEDRLAILVDLAKGPNASVQYGVAQARVSCPTDPTAGSTIVDLVGGRRVEYAAGAIRWGRFADRRYHIAAGERLQLAGLTAVPRSAACVVEVVVIAPDDLPGSSPYATQWQATTISLPRAASADSGRVAKGQRVRPAR